MSWEDQGRQYHMWFGHGTAPGKSSTGGADPSVTGKSTADRVQALAYGAIALLPAAQRRQAEAQYRNGTLPRLTAAMSAWMRGTRLDQATFADRFFGRSADDHVVRILHSAALDAATATSQADIREAAGKLAEAMQAVGLYQWPSFVADAEERARNPATVAAIEKSRQPPDPGKDAIRPVYPVETLLGIGAAAVAGGVAAAARVVVGAIARQALTNKSSSPPKIKSANELVVVAPSVKSESAASVYDKLSRYLLNADHPIGKSKAMWFRQALGFTRENIDDLAKQLVFDESKAVQTEITKYGTKFNQTINVVGANGRTIPVVTAWIRKLDGVVSLITAFPGK